MAAGEDYTTVIIGLGKTGYSCVEYFARRGVVVAVVDHDPSPALLVQLRAEHPQVPFVVFEQAHDLLLRAERLVVSPGVPLQQLAWLQNKEQLGDIELFCQEAKAPIIAITGSNGKTTVATMMGRVIEAAGLAVTVCGNIGRPVLDVLEDPVPDYYVLELSSFQLETTTSLVAKVAVVLNVTPDHMDRYKTFDEYVRIKQRIYQSAERVVINLDQHIAWHPAVSSELALGFSVEKKVQSGYGMCTHNQQMFFARDNQKLMAVSEVPMTGFHCWQNSLVILALTDSLDLPVPAALKVLREFSGLSHRCQLIAVHNGVRWVNDSKATNVGATIAAIKTLGVGHDGRLILILGGVAKDADFALLGDIVQRFACHVFLMGQAAAAIEAVLTGVAVSHVGSLDQAVLMAAEQAEPGDTVALSPACASFDMFDHYKHRGNEFVRLVECLR